MDEAQAIEATRCWIDSFIVKYNICPFARRELENNTIRYTCTHSNATSENLTRLAEEFIYLDTHEDTVTTLLIFTHSLQNFDDYLDFLEWSQQLLEHLKYEGIYQLASFHPDYCFAGSDCHDAANYSNRSPYPMLHIIRESSIEQALLNYPDPEQIPERNIALTRQLGTTVLKEIINLCLRKH
jgi:uncharacterized protein